MTNKALENSEKILDLPIDPNEEGGHVLKAKTSVINTALHTQVKVDETRLRRAEVDRLPALLKLVNEFAKKVPKGKVIEHDPNPAT